MTNQKNKFEKICEFAEKVSEPSHLFYCKANFECRFLVYAPVNEKKYCAKSFESRSEK